MVSHSSVVSGPVHGKQCGVAGQDRKFLGGPEIFEPVIGAITAGWRCQLEFKRKQPKTLSSLSAASWTHPRQRRTCPRSQKEPACGCNVLRMAGTSPAVSGGCSGVCSWKVCLPALTSGWAEGPCAASKACSKPRLCRCLSFWRCETLLFWHCCGKVSLGQSPEGRQPTRVWEMALGAWDIATLKLTPPVREGALRRVLWVLSVCTWDKG